MKTDSPFYHALQKPQRTHSVFPAVAKTALVAVLSAAVLAGCAVGPDYVIPETDVPVAYKEDSLWKTAKPADEYPRGQWWSVFREPEPDHRPGRGPVPAGTGPHETGGIRPFPDPLA